MDDKPNKVIQQILLKHYNAQMKRIVVNEWYKEFADHLLNSINEQINTKAA